MEIIRYYFPSLTEEQISRIEHLKKLYQQWNQKINLVSRKDINQILIRHILHSLSIHKIFHIKRDLKVLDAGTGGGLPGLPLAICNPENEFTLIDSTEKKIRVVENMIFELGINNVKTIHERLEHHKEKYDLITARAVKNLPVFLNWTKSNIRKNFNDSPNGILYLKGGDIEDELKKITKKYIYIYLLNEYFDEEYFETKKLVHIYGF
ncbi:MAG: 16S rRNA (guanine(527)-N(7))-methyltransferase RsmG [Flavobacteriales bacterium]